MPSAAPELSLEAVLVPDGRHVGQMLARINAMALYILITFTTAYLVTKWLGSRLTRWWGMLVAISLGFVVGWLMPPIVYISFLEANQTEYSMQSVISLFSTGIFVALFASCISGPITIRKNRYKTLNATRPHATASAQDHLQDARRRAEELRYRN